VVTIKARIPVETEAEAIRILKTALFEYGEKRQHPGMFLQLITGRTPEETRQKLDKMQKLSEIAFNSDVG
jgi:hypothetical protein